MYALRRNQIEVLLTTLALAVAGTGCKRTPRDNAASPPGRPLGSSPAAAVAARPQPAPVLAPPEPSALAAPPAPKKLLPVLPVPPKPLPKPVAIPKPLPGDDLTTLRKIAPDDLEPVDGVVGGVVGDTSGSVAGGVAGGTAGSVDPTASDDRRRTLPRPAADNATPAFPPDADATITDARVTLRVSIDVDGSVSAVHATSGATPFTTAALAAARSWHFEPATLGGSPVAMTINMVVAFRR